MDKTDITIAGGAVWTIRCTREGCWNKAISQERSEARFKAEAVARGWQFSPNGAVCPSCVAKDPCRTDIEEKERAVKRASMPVPPEDEDPHNPPLRSNKKGYIIKTPEMIMGERVKDARAEKGYTQKVLATKAGLPRAAIARIEAGERKIMALELPVLATTLGKSLEYFYPVEYRLGDSASE